MVGAVSFLTKKLLTDQNFNDFVQNGDMVMADRGFTIEDELGARGATLKIPAFTKKQEANVD